MTVGELRAHLESLPDDMEVLAAEQDGGWVSYGQTHPLGVVELTVTIHGDGELWSDYPIEKVHEDFARTARRAGAFVLVTGRGEE